MIINQSTLEAFVFFAVKTGNDRLVCELINIIHMFSMGEEYEIVKKPVLSLVRPEGSSDVTH